MHGGNILAVMKNRISLHVLAVTREGRVNKVKMWVMCNNSKKKKKKEP